MPANTSSAVIYRYKQKHYKRIVADLDREVVERWEERLKAEGIGKSEFIRNAILSYLEKPSE
jgi:metal-responsive CopG/Arc/MetJ family transcriptional regulator